MSTVSHDGHRGRMRERLRKGGIAGLQDHELLEYILYAFIPRKDTNPIAHELIDRFGSLSKVLNSDPKSLLQVSGMTENAALFLTLLPQIARKYIGDAENMKGVNLSAKEAACKFLAPKFYGLTVEQVHCVALDAQYKFVGGEMIASGTGNNVDVTVRQVVDFALRHKAVGVIIAHNHPSGNVKPSLDDVQLTNRINETLDNIGVQLCDHIIFSGDSNYSFRENNYIK